MKLVCVIYSIENSKNTYRDKTSYEGFICLAFCSLNTGMKSGAGVKRETSDLGAKFEVSVTL